MEQNKAIDTSWTDAKWIKCISRAWGEVLVQTRHIEFVDKLRGKIGIHFANRDLECDRIEPVSSANAPQV